MKQILTLFTGLLMLIYLSSAQENGEIATARLRSSVDKFKPGSSHRIAVELTIQKPYHINSHQPSEAYLIPTTLELETPEGVTLGRIKYPEAELKQFAFSETPLAVYEGTVHLFTTVTIVPDFAGKEVVLKGTVGYQACDDETCLPPDDIAFSQSFPVAASEEAIAPINQQLFAAEHNAASEDEGEGTGGGHLAVTVQQKGLLLTFMLVFLGGLALNLTPCVYPLIPITISYFGGQAQGKKGSLVTHAIIYVIGMAVTYSVLGVMAALTGNLLGAALQNPLVLIGIAVILVGLALSMFNVYEIRVPASLANFAGGSRQGIFGTLFMGLTVGIVAAPCIGPFVLGLLTYVGEKGDPILGFLMFFILALGLGLPFLFLGIFSGSINKLPRSGAWMVWVRTIFGFVLIAIAIYFLQPLFPNKLLYHLALTFTLLIGGIYMAWLEPTKTPGRVFQAVRNGVGILFFAAALVIASNGIESHVDRELAEANVASGAQQAGQKIQWHSYSESQLNRARNQNKPLMIDFYADWCIPCKELDQFTFSAPEVVETSRDFVMIKVDLTTSDDPLSKTLKTQYRVKGVPTLVFLSPDGTELKDLRIVGFVDKEEFLPVMQTALERTGQSS